MTTNKRLDAIRQKRKIGHGDYWTVAEVDFLLSLVEKQRKCLEEIVADYKEPQYSDSDPVYIYADKAYWRAKQALKCDEVEHG